MSEAATVSVVVPLYNKRPTIERTIDSVLAQTVQDFELVVVDDGSSDGGPELVERRYADPRVRVHRQPNAGPGAARNRGAELSSAPLLAFLDADDEWFPPFLARATEKLADHPECAAFTAAFLVGAEGRDRWASLRARGFAEGPWRLTSDIQREQLRDFPAAFSSSSAVYRREVFQALGGFYAADRCLLGEDIYLWLKILLNHPIYRHLEPLAHYHMEDSDLAIAARRESLPLEPLLGRPDDVRAVCPRELRDVLELWLAQHAARYAFMQLDRGDVAAAKWLLRTYPRISAWPSDHLKLRVRTAIPGLWTAARRLAGRG